MVKIKSELDSKKAPLSSIDNDGFKPTTTDNLPDYQTEQQVVTQLKNERKQSQH